MSEPAVPSGLPELDELLSGLRPGDNVVWQVERLEDYRYFASRFAAQCLKDRRRTVYLRFAPHPPVLHAAEGLEFVALDPAPGFDHFSGAAHRAIDARGRGVCYVLDSLSALVAEWATDELLADFFQVVCPHLFELETVAYFALARGRHAHRAVARIRDTTQVLLDVFRSGKRRCLHPLKVWDRYSPRMFLPHVLGERSWRTMSRGGGARDANHAAAGSIAPWESVHRKLQQHLGAGGGKAGGSGTAGAEATALRQELARMLLGNHPEFNRLAEQYLGAEDLLAIRRRMIGSGRIGGKAAGMLLARRILEQTPGETDFGRIAEAHDSFYIGSDVFFTFLVRNDLFRLRMQLARQEQCSRQEFEEVAQRFLAGKFEPEIEEQFRELLAHYGAAPIIVRSSSLLEDSFGNAFAGKYVSEFCANQGTPKERLAALAKAVKTVYASALNPDALSYRRQRGLLESDEQMAILVQRVSGQRHGRYFFPPLAGVAFSRNLFRWTSRLDPARGSIRLVFGLGTRAVNRVGGDYPRMIAVSHPLLRPEVGEKIAKYSQHEVDVLDLETNQFATLPFADLVAEAPFPRLPFFVSVRGPGSVYDPVSILMEAPPRDLVLTFNNLIRNTALVKILGEALAILETAYGHPVDTEFTAAVDEEGRIRLNLLQCRPMRLPGAPGEVKWPEDLPPARVLFRAWRAINGGEVEKLRFVLYVDPERYAALSDQELKKSLGRVVGQVNKHPLAEQHKLLMMGPGRWGSSNIELGVNVGYADLYNAAVLVELAREEAGQVPEVSYGTHFFQDLVEGRIIYLPVYPCDPKAQFNAAFFEQAPNVLEELVPGAARFRDCLKVIDLPAAAGGAYARVVADAQNQAAVAYLKD